MKNIIPIRQSSWKKEKWTMKLQLLPRKLEKVNNKTHLSQKLKYII